MKYYTVAALALLPSLAMAEGKPAGILETSNVSAYGYFDHTSLGGGYDIDYCGFGVAVSQKLHENDKFGINAGLRYDYTVDSSGVSDDEYRNNSYTPSATLYLKKDGFLPFITTQLAYSNSKYSDGSDGVSTWFGAIAGIEFHAMPGWYVTPQVTLWERIHANFDTSSSFADYGVESGYWVTDKAAVYATANYHNVCSSKDLWFNVGVRMSY
jgi:hypothetical protein